MAANADTRVDTRKDYLQRLSQVSTVTNLNPQSLIKVDKMETWLEFLETKRTNPNLNQDQICSKMHVSRSSINRIRKDLGLPSPYRYEVSDKTEAQKERAKEKRREAKATGTDEEQVKSHTKRGRPSKKTDSSKMVGGTLEQHPNEERPTLETLNRESKVKSKMPTADHGYDVAKLLNNSIESMRG